VERLVWFISMEHEIDGHEWWCTLNNPVLVNQIEHMRQDELSGNQPKSLEGLELESKQHNRNQSTFHYTLPLPDSVELTTNCLG
jgi:hypothetical protein